MRQIFTKVAFLAAIGASMAVASTASAASAIVTESAYQAPEQPAETQPVLASGAKCNTVGGCRCGHVIVANGCTCHITPTDDGVGNGICEKYEEPKPSKPLWKNPWFIGIVLAGIVMGIAIVGRKKPTS